MKTEQIVQALKAGGTLTIDWPDWRIDSAHPENDRPARFDVDDDSVLDEEEAWWNSLRVCGNGDTETVHLVEALAQLAGLKLRRP